MDPFRKIVNSGKSESAGGTVKSKANKWQFYEFHQAILFQMRVNTVLLSVQIGSYVLVPKFSWQTIWKSFCFWLIILLST